MSINILWVKPFSLQKTQKTSYLILVWMKIVVSMDRWFEWLSNCKATLGSPSGSNVFDFDGSIAEAFKDAGGRKSRVPNSILKRIDHLDNKFNMDQISPRVFEATAKGCALIMVKGVYSDILVPGTHYLPIDSDFSNVSDILDSVRDTNLLSSLAERTYSDLLTSDLYSYKSFASLVRNKLGERITRHVRYVEVPIAPELVDTSANPRHELPTLQPIFFDTFKLKLLLASLSDNSYKLIFKLFLGKCNAYYQLCFLKPISLLVSVLRHPKRRFIS